MVNYDRLSAVNFWSDRGGGLKIGVLVGTYSSIFIASPVVLGLGISREDMLPVKKEEAEADGLP